MNAASAKAKTLEPAPLGPNTSGLFDSHFRTAAEFTFLSRLNSQHEAVTYLQIPLALLPAPSSQTLRLQ
jgi:hypothetical protein